MSVGVCLAFAPQLGQGGAKFEIRSTKLETNSNVQKDSAPASEVARFGLTPRRNGRIIGHPALPSAGNSLLKGPEADGGQRHLLMNPCWGGATHEM